MKNYKEMNTTNSALTDSALTAVENKIPNVSNLVKYIQIYLLN